MRHELSEALGGIRGMLEAAAPFIAFTVAWLITGDLAPAIIAAAVVAMVLAVLRLVQKQSLRYVLQAVVPTGIAVVVAARTGRAEDAFLPGIVYNGVLALVFVLTIVLRRPVVGYLYGAAVGDPSGWTSDGDLVRLFRKLTAVLTVVYLIRVVVQLPLLLAAHVAALAIAKVVLGWPLLLLALAVIGVLLSRGRTPLTESRNGPPSDGSADLTERTVPGKDAGSVGG
ncbi:MAG: DUF3159 domain-containing protein [Propionibacteriaceae bacterium]